MRSLTVESLAEVPPAAWNALVDGDQPFLRHEVLAAMERHGCVGVATGWQPRHQLVYRSGVLVGACPSYVKTNSYGELVFDWAWADAYRRAGLPYYPKLVAAVPYTPITGPRLLAGNVADASTVKDRLIDGVVAAAQGMSTAHWLFPDSPDRDRLEDKGMLTRLGCQFHWHNPGYRDFQDFLDQLVAKKRKNILRERRRVQEAGIELEVLDGHAATEAHWEVFHDFYRDTFLRLGGYPTLSEAFFKELGASLPNTVVLVLARQARRYVAGALSLRGKRSLYGRHWGCRQSFDGLHFEACYYQGIEYCIRHGLGRFEPGAQGEHKVSRGFLPTATYSSHWVAHPAFRQAIRRHLAVERQAMVEYIEEMRSHSPYRAGTSTAASVA